MVPQTPDINFFQALHDYSWLRDTHTTGLLLYREISKSNLVSLKKDFVRGERQSRLTLLGEERGTE